jgi:glyoxylase-like metal-dependent hydrolase (beta-lactamase superfamily II)
LRERGQFGFNLTDIKVILNSHAHNDRAGGHAVMKKSIIAP